MFALLRDGSGATAVEYGRLIALIAITILVSVSLVGDSLEDGYGHLASALSTGAEPDEGTGTAGGKPNSPDPCGNGGDYCGKN